MKTVLLGGLIGILVIWITGFIFAFRKQLSCMAGMMASMALGMTSGLITGVILTIWLPGQFFISTMISVFTGGIIGIISGVPISLMAVMDGLLSGIMGGMMGTMLMVMIPLPYVNNTVKLMSILFSGILFLLFLTLQGEIKQSQLQKRPTLLSNTYPMFLLTVMFLAVPQLSPQNEWPNTLTDSHLNHNQEIPPTKTQADPLSGKELLVKAKEYSFSPSSMQVSVGEKIKITLDNDGQMEHDLEIVGTNVHIHAGTGERNSMVVSFDKAGYFQVICTLPGHKEAGMTASIQVIT
ncbi:cupredoxin domain-containing protein [Cohnella algarum]|uniref:cupredoxin domain-containing protein n=1 Tax=Cohnella algarum TaxID=2044859 RepID=UPI0019682AB9|nr:cupredoxin domain-containing protein [Cohnella algarum]MBN2981770.1 cupredoxin domain-containing protein [Cohnella algarum]